MEVAVRVAYLRAKVQIHNDRDQARGKRSTIFPSLPDLSATPDDLDTPMTTYVQWEI